MNFFVNYFELKERTEHKLFVSLKHQDPNTIYTAAPIKLHLLKSRKSLLSEPLTSLL
jgi:hypothetical protein